MAPPAPSVGTPSMGTQHLGIKSQSGMCEHLYFIPIYFVHNVSKMHPKVEEKPKRGYFLGSGTLKTFSIYINDNCFFTLCHPAYKKFHRNALLLEEGCQQCRFPYKEFCSKWGCCKGMWVKSGVCVCFQMGEIVACFPANGNSPVERPILMGAGEEQGVCWKELPAASQIQANRSCLP